MAKLHFITLHCKLIFHVDLSLPSNNSPMCVRFLLKKNVGLEIEDENGNTPLACAVLGNRIDIAIFLIEASNYTPLHNFLPKKDADFNRWMTTNPKPLNYIERIKQNENAKKEKEQENRVYSYQVGIGSVL